MATPYLTQAKLERIIGRDHLLAAACDPDTPDTVDAGRVEGAIEDVSARVDAQLRAHYELPLPDVPDFLSRAVARIVHGELVDQASTTDLIESRAAAAEKLVEHLAAGRLRIGGDLDGAPDTRNARTRQGRAAVVHRGTSRQFGRHDTEGIV